MLERDPQSGRLAPGSCLTNPEPAISPLPGVCAGDPLLPVAPRWTGVSPDGRYVYVVADSCVGQGRGGGSLALAADGRTLFALGYAGAKSDGTPLGAIIALERDTQTGRLTKRACLSQARGSGCVQAPELEGLRSVLEAGGDRFYALAGYHPRLLRYSFDRQSSRFSLRDCLSGTAQDRSCALTPRLADTYFPQVVEGGARFLYAIAPSGGQGIVTGLAPAVAVRSDRLRLTRKGKGRLELSCPPEAAGGRCSGMLSVRAPDDLFVRRALGRALSSTPYALPAGARRSFRVGIPPRVVRPLLVKRGRTRLGASASDATGAVEPSRRSIIVTMKGVRGRAG